MGTDGSRIFDQEMSKVGQEKQYYKTPDVSVKMN